jgi:hypothetical protein
VCTSTLGLAGRLGLLYHLWQKDAFRSDEIIPL